MRLLKEKGTEDVATRNSRGESESDVAMWTITRIRRMIRKFTPYKRHVIRRGDLLLNRMILTTLSGSLEGKYKSFAHDGSHTSPKNALHYRALKLNLISGIRLSVNAQCNRWLEIVISVIGVGWLMANTSQRDVSRFNAIGRFDRQRQWMPGIMLYIFSLFLYSLYLIFILYSFRTLINYLANSIYFQLNIPSIFLEINSRHWKLFKWNLNRFGKRFPWKIFSRFFTFNMNFVHTCRINLVHEQLISPRFAQEFNAL